jgi:hypothetical protein
MTFMASRVWEDNPGESILIVLSALLPAVNFGKR